MPVGTEVAAIGPAYRWHEADAEIGEVGLLLPGGEFDVGASPSRRTCVFVAEAVEPGAARPIVKRGRANRIPARRCSGLSTRPAEGSEGPSTEVGVVLLIDHEDAFTSASQFVGRDQSGQARTDHDDVNLHVTTSILRSAARLIHL